MASYLISDAPYAPWLSEVLATLEEHKIDRIRWQQAVDLAAEDYFNVNAVLSYLVRINLVARWTQLDEARGRAMLGRLLRVRYGHLSIHQSFSRLSASRTSLLYFRSLSPGSTNARVPLSKSVPLT